MKQAIRALSWAITVFSTLLLLFTITSAYSAVLIARGLNLGSPSTSVQGGTLTVSLPFRFGNTGLYDISDFNITTLIRDHNGFNVSESSTYVPLIPMASSNFTVTHDISLNASKIASDNLSYLLFNDTDLQVDATLGLNFARVIPIELGTNISLPWGAPFYGLSVSNVSSTMLSPSLFRLTITISYENHAFFDLNGTVELQLLNNAGNQVATSTVNLLPRGGQIPITFQVQNPHSISRARLFFHTSYFNYGPYEISGLRIP